MTRSPPSIPRTVPCSGRAVVPVPSVSTTLRLVTTTPRAEVGAVAVVAVAASTGVVVVAAVAAVVGLTGAVVVAGLVAVVVAVVALAARALTRVLARPRTRLPLMIKRHQGTAARRDMTEGIQAFIAGLSVGSVGFNFC